MIFHSYVSLPEGDVLELLLIRDLMRIVHSTHEKAGSSSIRLEDDIKKTSSLAKFVVLGDIQKIKIQL